MLDDQILISWRGWESKRRHSCPTTTCQLWIRIHHCWLFWTRPHVAVNLSHAIHFPPFLIKNQPLFALCVTFLFITVILKYLNPHSEKNYCCYNTAFCDFVATLTFPKIHARCTDQQFWLFLWLEWKKGAFEVKRVFICEIQVSALYQSPVSVCLQLQCQIFEENVCKTPCTSLDTSVDHKFSSRKQLSCPWSKLWTRFRKNQ